MADVVCMCLFFILCAAFFVTNRLTAHHRSAEMWRGWMAHTVNYLVPRTTETSFGLSRSQDILTSHLCLGYYTSRA